MAGKIFIGTSGYNYWHWWNGVFYPPEVPQRKWLEYYVRYFDTVELNVSFYRLPRKETFTSWYKRTPAHFLFALKGSRFITHVKRLKECQEPLNLFFDYAQGLKEKLGIVLWQLPPQFPLNLERLKDFCQLLASHELAGHVRQAFEFRHPDWFKPEVYQCLREYNFSLCIAHSPEYPESEEVTADFVYLRFHGGKILYGSKYTERELVEWGKKITHWLEQEKDVYVYFNNDAHGYAVENALRLGELITK